VRAVVGLKIFVERLGSVIIDTSRVCLVDWTAGRDADRQNESI